jgi:ATP-dependent helicase/nuclease subunit A
VHEGQPRDAEARRRIEREFDRTFLVEAGAGSGKTRSLARRMAAGIAAGVYRVEHMAAVTFTRKAAAELRGRFQEALEARLRGEGDGAAAPAAPPPDECARLEAALENVERLYAGTIHAFCAQLLRERPVEAGMAPGFAELDEVEDVRRRRLAWRAFLAQERARGSAPLLELTEVGLRPPDLDRAFAIVCDHEDVEFPPGEAAAPDAEAGWAALEAFWARLGPLVPRTIPGEARCKALRLAADFGDRLAAARRHRRTRAALAELLGEWERVSVTMKWWGQPGGEARRLVEEFQRDVAIPYMALWRHYVYRVAMTVLAGARGFDREARRRDNVVNFVDLLMETARLLRDHHEVRRALQAKYRWLFVDEFQDTDPIQAEIFLWLASDAAPGSAPAAMSAFDLPLRPGALFVVGDPKQSIYRFRRADIDIYHRVRARIVACGGEVLHLTANWRSLPGVCRLANEVFPGRFPAEPTRESPAFEPLDPQRADPGGDAACVRRLVIPETVGREEAPAWEAERIARVIRAEVDAGRRRYGSFLILTRFRPRLRIYAEALERHDVPVEVSGAGRFGDSRVVRVLADLLVALGDPADGPALVGVLRGPLFGIADADLFAFRRAGGRFDLAAPLAGADADRLAEFERLGGDPRGAGLARHLDECYGRVLPALRRLRGWRRLTRRLPLPAAVDRILEESGWLALAAATPGGAAAGDLLQAVDRVRQAVERGGGIMEAADALVEDEEAAGDVETLPLEPGRRDVVRLMNLHRAKGLEADVVFLADPMHGRPFPVDLRIVRDGGSAVGYMRIERRREDSFGRGVVLAEPVGWAAHEAEEQRYRQAEIDRLLYVAATRARDLLVVGQWERTNQRGERANDAWGVFDDFLEQCPVLAVPEVALRPSGAPVDLSEEARERARASRAARHDAARRASWEMASVTGEHVPVRTRSARVRAAMALAPAAGADPAGGEAGETFGGGKGEERAAPDRAARPPATAATPMAIDGPTASTAPMAAASATERVDAGAAWGTLVHGLLEHAMRHDGATRADLERLARWLTLEQPELRAAIPAALDLVEAVSRAAVWGEARGAEETLAEVPFAVRLASEGSTARVLRGVIDLAYRDPDGWRIVDYKTDVDVSDPQALLERHGGQIHEYRAAWAALAGGRAPRAGLFALRSLRIVWV